MNHIYRSLWSAALNTWIAVAENSKSKTKSHNPRRKLFVAGLLACSPCAWALPTGEQIVAGQATVNTPNPGQMQINQATPQAIINWQGFSIQPQEIVKIQQPTINATLLNRVIGADASVIQGQLSANGQVFLINPNGVLFSPSAQVDVGGLIASTHSISNADFLKGNYHFTQNFSEGILTNQGLIRVPEGGVVALIGSQVTNDGTISTPKGTTALAAGKTVDLDFQGDGLVEVKVPQAALDAQVANKGAILADGGRVILTAQAANELLNTAVNQSGVIQARSLVERNGEIILAGGDNGTTQVSGTLDTSGQTGGGKISVTGKNVNIQSVANLSAQTLESGKAGNIAIFGDMKNGQLNVAGKLDASAPKTGDGGFIETSAAQVNIADSAKISTKAEQGKSGTWLIDPTDYTIAASGGNMTGAALSSALGAGAVNIDVVNSAVSGNGDVNINDPVSWSAHLLTLSATRNININSNLNGSSTAQLALHYGRASATGTTEDYFINNGAKISLPAGVNFSTQKGYSGANYSYQVINSLGVAGDATTTTLQGIANNLGGNYALGADINASTTSGWNGGAGFAPIGDTTTAFTGHFDGLGHTITGLTTNINIIAAAGLFAESGAGSTISNIGMVGGSVSSSYNFNSYAGGLVGINYGTINNAYATGSVSSDSYAGGLVGYNNGSINNAYATGGVSSSSYAGGLVGYNYGTINNAYATGGVSSSSYAGGLVGYNGATINNAYATGGVSSSFYAGGLVGSNGGIVTNSFWNTQTSGQTTSTGGTGLTTAQMKTASTFSGWNMSTTGGSSAVWRIYDGQTYPLLRSFLTPLTVTANAITKTYNGLSDSVLSSPTYSVTPNANLLGLSSPYAPNKNVGSYTATGLYSNQQGYDISLSNIALTINPAPVNLTGTRVYDGSTSVASSALTIGALPASETLTLSGTGTMTDKNVGTAKPLTLNTISLGNGTGLASNYTFTGGTQTVNITPAPLTINAVTATKPYDATTTATGTPTASGLKTGDTLTGLSQAFANKNVLGTNGSTLTVNSGYTLTDGNAGGNYTVSTNTAAGTITPLNLAVNLTGTRVYDHTTTVSGSALSMGTLSTGETLTLTGSGTIANKNVGTAKSVTGTFTPANGTGLASNYSITFGTKSVNITPASLTVSGITANNKTYDGNISATLAGTINYAGLFSGDVVSFNGTGTFSDKNVATVKTVNLSNSYTGADVNNYTIAHQSTTTANITPKNLTVTGITANNKTYDGNTSATLNAGSAVYSGRVSGDAVSFNGTGTFSDKNVANGKIVSLSNSYTGLDVGNYTITHQPTTTANITPADVNITATPVTKTYDGTTAALSIAKVADGVLFKGDLLSGGNFAFTDKNAGTGKTVTVSGVKIDDGNGGKNYSVNYVNNINSLIKKADLTFTSTDVNKVYDGTTGASGSAVLANGSILFGKDSFSGGSFAFADKNVGTNKTVSTTQVFVNDGNNGDNYAVNYQDNTHSTITPAALTLNATSDNKVYDGTPASTAAVTFTGLVGGDTLSGLTQSFASKNALGANQSTLSVNSADYALNDGNAGQNYNVTTHTASGTITPANLTLSTNDVVKTYDGTTTAVGTAKVTTGVLFGGDVLSGGNFAFLDKNAGAGKTVTVSNVTIDDGNGGHNYSVNYSNNINSLINKALLTLTAADVTKTYDGTTSASSGVVVANGNLLGGDSLSGGTFAFADSNIGTNKTVTVNGVTINDGNSGNNYALSYADNTNSTIQGTLSPISLPKSTTLVGGNSATIATNGGSAVAGGASVTGKVSNGVTNNASSTASQSDIFRVNATNNITANTVIVSTVASLVTTSTNSATAIATGTSGIGSNPIAKSMSLNAPASVSATGGLSTVSGGSIQASDAVAVDFTGGDTVSSSPSSSESADGNTSTTQPGVTKTSANNSTSLTNVSLVNEKNRLIMPVLTVKNSAGRVKDLELSTNKQYISLLLEDGTIRVWDLVRGVQRRIDTQSGKKGSMNIGRVDEKSEVLSIASQSGINTYDVISSSADTLIPESNVSYFVSSNDATLLLTTIVGSNRLSLWDTKHDKKQWDSPYQRGIVKSLAMTDNKHYAAVLSQERSGVYAFTTDLQLNNLADAVDILDLSTGKIIKSLPSFGEQVINMQFKDNETLQIALANGKVMEWSLATQTPQTVVHFAKAITSIDRADQKYAYVLTDGSVQVADNQGHIELSVENTDNPFQHARLLENGKKLLTVMANGDLAIWDMASGKKMLRLFSTKQGWTVMDAFGRFDGSEEAMENFVWLAETQGLSIDNFSENYYEPGLLANLLKNQDYFNGDGNAIDKGITLPPKLALQLADKQAGGDSVTLQLDLYDRGGGISNVKFYQNDRLISSEGVVTAEQKLTENSAEHRVLTLKVTPTSGENTFKVVASNEMDIENSSPELHFDGKSKAYNASLKVLTIGINRYKEKQLHLNYSVADASLMSDVLKKHAKIAVSKSLLDENATKVKILSELKELSQGTQQDSLVIYLAGHGVAMGKEWYFLPYETQLLPTLKEIVANGISASELSDIFKNSKIQHILLMVDSCHSGGSMDVFSQLENGQRFFTRQLSRSLGITVITAAAKNQEAKELKSLGHGLFTYLMSQELQKNTPSEPVTAHTIAKAILKTLPAFSKTQIGAAQEPVSYMHGSDFILTGSLKK